MRERNDHALRRTSVTWMGGAFHRVCMTTDVRPPIPRMWLLLICGQLVDDCMISSQYVRILQSRRAVRGHHRAMDLENWTAERGARTFSVGERSRVCDDGAACDAVSSWEDAPAGELAAGSVAAGTDRFAQFGGDSCCGDSSQSRTVALKQVKRTGVPPCWPPGLRLIKVPIMVGRPRFLRRRQLRAAMVEMVDLYTLITHLVTPDVAEAPPVLGRYGALCGVDVSPSFFTRAPGNGYCQSCRTSVPTQRSVKAR